MKTETELKITIQKLRDSLIEAQTFLSVYKNYVSLIPEITKTRMEEAEEKIQAILDKEENKAW